MANVLVIGVGGAIGDAALAAFRRAGVKAVGVARRGRTTQPSEIPIVTADRTKPQSIIDVIRYRKIDVVIDVLAMTMKETTPLLDALDGLVKRYVLISSSDVYRNYGLLHRKETGEPLPWLSETSPLRTSRYPYRLGATRSPNDPALWLDHYDKIPIEDATRAMSIESTILRLPMVYGPSDRQKRFNWAAAPMKKDAPELAAPREWLDWTTTYGFSGNVGWAIAQSALAPGAANETFNVVDHAPISNRGWAEAMAARLGWSGEITPSYDPSHPLARGLALLNLSVPLAMDGSKLTGLIGEAPYSREDALTITLMQ
ncbi:MAG: NAD-dependent epimerase/dehydratase family protein [Alphaproteobacteria bacterium]|nr:NAD-dependent epimerase/dehydratase family protein [Alphaproteobacteria bacterium]